MVINRLIKNRCNQASANQKLEADNCRHVKAMSYN